MAGISTDSQYVNLNARGRGLDLDTYRDPYEAALAWLTADWQTALPDRLAKLTDHAAEVIELRDALALEAALDTGGELDGGTHLVEMPISAALADVIAERRRQVAVEGYDDDHDDEHDDGALVAAAVAYAEYAVDGEETLIELGDRGGAIPGHWPWDEDQWKPKTPRRDLVRAAALLVAEIERRDRAEQRSRAAREQALTQAQWSGHAAIAADPGLPIEGPGDPIRCDEEGRPICSPERPWTEHDGTPAIHPNAAEDGEQQPGVLGGDTVRMRCPDCGVTWRQELPQ